MLMHGSGLTHIVWSLHEQFYASQGYNVLSIDLPGHGSSEGPSLKSIEDMSSWVKSFMETLKIQKIIIDNLDNGTFFAKIIILADGKEIEMDSRPSDAMVIALKLGVPVYCEIKVIEKAGFKKSNLDIDQPNQEEPETNQESSSYSPLGEKERKSLSVFESFIDSLDIDEK